MNTPSKIDYSEFPALEMIMGKAHEAVGSGNDRLLEGAGAELHLLATAHLRPGEGIVPTELLGRVRNGDEAASAEAISVVRRAAKGLLAA